jgi:hypothetical protein
MSVTVQLFQELETAICAGDFSFRSGKYSRFASDEINFIEGSTGL